MNEQEFRSGICSNCGYGVHAGPCQDFAPGYGSDAEVTTFCRIGSCNRHRKCMYTPCRRALPHTVHRDEAPSPHDPAVARALETLRSRCVVEYVELRDGDAVAVRTPIRSLPDWAQPLYDGTETYGERRVLHRVESFRDFAADQRDLCHSGTQKARWRKVTNALEELLQELRT